MSNLSEAAQSALIDAHRAQGSPVKAPGGVLSELRFQGYVGPDGGLTRSGSIKRERLVNAKLDAAF